MSLSAQQEMWFMKTPTHYVAEQRFEHENDKVQEKLP
jgi:hypothetical protein